MEPVVYTSVPEALQAESCMDHREGFFAEEALESGAVAQSSGYETPRPAAWCRATRRSAVFVVPLLLLTAVAGSLWPTGRLGLLRTLGAAESLLGASEVAGPCGSNVEDTDIWTGAALYEVPAVPSAEQCRTKCESQDQCGAWTWGKDRHVQFLTDVCWLKKLQQGSPVEKRPKEGVVSGLACRAKGAPLLDPPTEGSERFDCQGGADAWQVAWSVEQQQWCCRHKRAGCPDSDDGLQDATPEGHRQGIAEGATRIANVAPITDCADSADDTDYYTGRPLDEVFQIAKGPDCRAKCEADPKCGAWTWGKNPGIKGLEGVCFLKALAPGQHPRPDAKTGVVSGIPCRDAGGAPATVSSPKVSSDASEAVAPMQPAPGSNCGEVEESMDYQTSTSLGQVNPVPTPEKCIQECEKNHKCAAWTWGSARGQFGLTDVCFLKGVKTGEKPQRHSKEGVVSGVPCHTSQWLKKGSIAEGSRPATLFCFALMLPHTYEQHLLAMQYRLGASLFACDAHTIYSNMSIVVAGDIVSHVVESDLKCSMGGEFGTALNTEIFLAVWKVVASETTYMSCDFTAKVDPDAVFLPERLRVALQGHAERPEGVYLNNCWRGMHGPVEVFSRNAVTAWSRGTQRCLKHFNKLCSGPCQWGEDMFVDQCLSKVLEVRRDNDYALLIEDHCDPPSNWQSCEDEGTVAFHPFKKLNDYMTCLQTADPSRVLTTTSTRTITQTVTTTFTTVTQAPVVPSYPQADGAGSQSGLLEDHWPTPSPSGGNTFPPGGGGLLTSTEGTQAGMGEPAMPVVEAGATSATSVSRQPSSIAWGQAAVQSASPASSSSSSSELQWGMAQTAEPLATPGASPAAEVMSGVAALSDASTTQPDYSGLAA